MLLVDAYEGPQAQTRFVYPKGLGRGIESGGLREQDRPAQCTTRGDAGCGAGVVWSWMRRRSSLTAPLVSRRDLPETVWRMRVRYQTSLRGNRAFGPASKVEESDEFRMLVSSVDWSGYVGRIGWGKVAQVPSKSVNLKTLRWFETKRYPRSSSIPPWRPMMLPKVAGNIVGIAGFEDGYRRNPGKLRGFETLPFVEIDPPTVMMSFSVNDGPMAGRKALG